MGVSLCSPEPRRRRPQPPLPDFRFPLSAFQHFPKVPSFSSGKLSAASSPPTPSSIFHLHPRRVGALRQPQAPAVLSRTGHQFARRPQRRSIPVAGLPSTDRRPMARCRSQARAKGQALPFFAAYPDGKKLTLSFRTRSACPNPASRGSNSWRMMKVESNLP
jgi:hypothetical protein